MDTLFSLSSLLVMPFWLLMIALPRWRATFRLMGSSAVVVPAALLYAGLVLPRLASVLPAVTRPELAGIAALLGSPDGATIAWVHFLAFDLFVGRWTYLDARERGLSAWLVSPLLFLTLMLGPLGLAAYLGLRAAPRQALGRSVRAAMAANRPLALLGLLMVATLGVTLVGLLVDGRVITGQPAWLKPAKFAISIVFYAFSLLWLLGFVRGHRRLVKTISGVTAAALVGEMVIIVLQVVRGTTSHFNVSTPLDGALWSAMGVMIVLVWLANLAAAVLLLRQRLPDRTLAWGLRFALLVSLLGMAVAFPMTVPTSEQIARAGAGGGMPTAGAHTMGAPDGGPGLPVVGWSTEAGDLRPAHFVGLHALQALPLAAWLISRRRSLGAGHQTALVCTTGAAYAGLVLLLTWQALRGQPLIAPDAATLTALFGLLAAAGLSVAGILLHARLDSLSLSERARSRVTPVFARR